MGLKDTARIGPTWVGLWLAGFVGSPLVLYNGVLPRLWIALKT